MMCDGCGRPATRRWGAISLCAACYRLEVPVVRPERPVVVAVVPPPPPPAPVTIPAPPRAARDLDLDPAAPPGRCRILDCPRPTRTRGLCDSCHCAARRKGRADLLLSPRPRNVTTAESVAIRAQIVAMADHGVTPADVRTALSLTRPQVKEHLRRLVSVGALTSVKGRYMLPDPAP